MAGVEGDDDDDDDDAESNRWLVKVEAAHDVSRDAAAEDTPLQTHGSDRRRRLIEERRHRLVASIAVR